MGRNDKFESFDYENAELDILDAGGDPDCLNYNNREKRDRFLKDMGLDPKSYGSTVGNDSKKKSGWFDEPEDDPCFLTSACVHARGLPDDCEELTLLRRYRDTYLRGRAGGEDAIREYYDIAPDIVSRINKRKDADTIWNSVYEDMILPCISMIREGRMEEAFELYRSCTLRLRET
ncbi:MAG: hypothetical protein J5569_07725 [Oscillospiraceae bacterium]|nr:hypothetical protein [Oscillospiraceae bacterium]